MVKLVSNTGIRAAQRLQHPAYRKIGGKQYLFKVAYFGPQRARMDAAALRKRGYSARVVKVPRGYAVYARKGK